MKDSCSVELPAKYKVENVRCEQQTNSLDCGIFTMFFAERLTNDGKGRFASAPDPTWMRPYVAARILKDRFCTIHEEVNEILKQAALESVDKVIEGSLSNK